MDEMRILTPAEIESLRAEVKDVTTPPPPDRPYWDVFRIVATLDYLTEAGSLHTTSPGYRRSVRDALQQAAAITSRLAVLLVPFRPEAAQRDVAAVEAFAARPGGAGRGHREPAAAGRGVGGQEEPVARSP